MIDVPQPHLQGRGAVEVESGADVQAAAEATWREIRRYFGGGSWLASHNRVLLNPTTVGASRYRYRGTAIPVPWPAAA